MLPSAAWGKEAAFRVARRGAGRPTLGSAARAAADAPSSARPAATAWGELDRLLSLASPTELPGRAAQCQAEVGSAAALEMRLQPQGRQGHIPNMSWLNKAIYQQRVDTAELGTESQRALAMGPCNIQGAWGALGRVEKSPLLLPLGKKATGTAVPRAGRPGGHHPGEGLIGEMLPACQRPAGVAHWGSRQPGKHPEVPRCPKG